MAPFDNEVEKGIIVKIAVDILNKTHRQSLQPLNVSTELLEKADRAKQIDFQPSNNELNYLNERKTIILRPPVENKRSGSATELLRHNKELRV